MDEQTKLRNQIDDILPLGIWCKDPCPIVTTESHNPKDCDCYGEMLRQEAIDRIMNLIDLRESQTRLDAKQVSLMKILDSQQYR